MASISKNLVHLLEAPALNFNGFDWLRFCSPEASLPAFGRSPALAGPNGPGQHL
jgi:hypothetical protein